MSTKRQVNKVPTLPGRASAVAPTYEEGDEVELSVDLAGALRTAGGSGGLTDAELRATPVPVSGTVSVTEPVTVDGTVTANAGSGTFATDPTDDPTRDLGKIDIASLDQYTPLTGALPVNLRDALGNPLELGAGAFNASVLRVGFADGAVTNVDITKVGGVTQGGDNSVNPAVKVAVDPARANAAAPTWGEGNLAPLSVDLAGKLRVDGSSVTQPVSGPLTDAQLRATAVPISGTVTANPTTYFGKTIIYVSISQGAAGTTELAAASVGNKHKVIGLTIVMDLGGTVKLNDGTVDLTGAMSLVTSGGMVWATSLIPYTETAGTNRPLHLITTVGAAKGMVAILTEP